MGKNKKWKRAFAAYAAVCLMGSIFPARMNVYAAENTALTETGDHDTGQEETGIPESTEYSGAETAGLQDGTGTGQSGEQTGAGSTLDNEESGQAQDADPAADSAGTDGLEDEDAVDDQESMMDSLADDSASPSDDQGSTDMIEGDNGTLVDDSLDPGQDGGEDTDNGDQDGPADGTTPVSDGSYTDTCGITYLYNICEDGTADIYSIEDYSGKEMDIPAEMDGHTVTRLTFCLRDGDIAAVTIPETVTYIGGMAFGWTSIGTLRYNAAAALAEENTVPAPFSSAEIGNLLIGENVSVISDHMFQFTKFLQDDLVLTVPTICENAFQSAEFQKLTIGEGVRSINIYAFAWTKIGELCWDAKEVSYGEGLVRNAPFIYASISGVSFGGTATEIPSCFLANAKLSISSLDIPSNITSIGSCAFYDAAAEDASLDSLVIGENMAYLGGSAFYGWSIGVLEYRTADAATDGPDGNGPFQNVQAGGLCIGENVEVLPAKIFCGMGLEKDELDISGNIVSVEDKAFCRGAGKAMNIGTLTIGKNVAHIGMFSFAVDSIGTLNYNAADAGAGSGGNPLGDPFSGVKVGRLNIGEDVRKIPACTFFAMKLSQNVLELPSGLTDIGAQAFWTREGDISIGSLVVRENVSHIGWAAFKSCSIGKAIVHALEGDVEYGDAGLEELGLPECGSVEIHGGSDYYNYFTAKTAQEGITLMCSDFEYSTGEEYYDAEKGCFVVPVTETCTECGYQKLSGEYADAYTVIFQDHDGTELSRQAVHEGADAAAPKDPERIGWRFTGWDGTFTDIRSDLTVTAQYEIQKYLVIFKDGDTVLSRQEVEYGSDAKLPEDPTRPDEEWGKWKFTGWDGSYTKISKDETVSAVFEKDLNQYEVIFYDAAGNILSTQTVAHGGKARMPQAPEKEADKRYKYIFKGWDGDTEMITGDVKFHPVYGQETRTYKVTFMNGETVFDVQEVAYGADASVPPEPIKETDGQYIYKFAGWDGSFSFITEDTVIKALFDSEKADSGNNEEKNKDKDKEDTSNKDKENGGKDKDKDKEDTGNKDKENNGNDTEKENDKDKGDKDKDKDKDKEDTSKDKENDGKDKDKGKEDDGGNSDDNKGDKNNNTDKKDTGNGLGNGSNDAGNDPNPDKENAGNNTDKDSSDSGTDKDDSDNGDGSDKDKDTSGNGNGGSVPGKENNGNPVSDGNGKKEPETDADKPGTGNQAPVATNGSGTGTRQELYGQTQDKTCGTLRIVNAAAGTGRKLDGAVFAVYDRSGAEIKRLTTQDGEASLSLPAGSYSLLELEAAAGYKAEKTQIAFTILKGQETLIEVINISGLKNTDPQELIAKTGGSSAALWYLLAAACFAAAALCAIGLCRMKRK